MTGSGEPMDVTERPTDRVVRVGDTDAVSMHVDVRQGEERAGSTRDVVFDATDVSVFYGDFRAVRDLTVSVYEHEIVALIGPSGCGKTTFLRCLNRMNDLIEGARVEGDIRYHGIDLYGAGVDPVEVRRRIGMVFQKSNPFPKSIFENVAYGPRVAGTRQKAVLYEIVEKSL